MQSEYYSTFYDRKRCVYGGYQVSWTEVMIGSGDSEINRTNRSNAHRSSRSRRGREHELGVLYAIAEALNSSVDVGQALERTLALVADLLGLPTAWVWLLDAETDQFYLAAAHNLPPYLREPVRMTGGWCVCTDEFRRGILQPSNVDTLECSRLKPGVSALPADATQGLRYHATIPLAVRDRRLGILNVAGPSWRGLSEAELRLLSTVAYQAGLAVERARLASEGARLARLEERTRIAREIHDTLAQGLTAIGLDIEGALRHLADDPERARERLERARATTRDSLEEARQSVLDLREAPPGGRSLAGALAALGRTFTSETGVQVEMQVGEEPALPPRVEAELFRIAREALTNVRRHAHATRVRISLRTTPRAIVLSIQDDGTGLGPAPDAEERHGVIGMRERAKGLGGSLRVTSRPGHGTTVSMQAPFPVTGEAAS